MEACTPSDCEKGPGGFSCISSRQYLDSATTTGIVRVRLSGLGAEGRGWLSRVVSGRDCVQPSSECPVSSSCAVGCIAIGYRGGTMSTRVSAQRVVRETT